MNKKLSKIGQSINVELANTIRKMESQGESITKMQTGDPDFATPKLICEAATNAMMCQQTHYCASNGLIALRRAISDKLSKENNIDASPEQNVMVTHGGVHGLYLALQAIVDYGDEVIIISPYWMPYHSNIMLAGGIPVVVETHFENNFELSLEQIIQKITNQTKAIIINSPNNPTGVVYSANLLKSIAQLCQQHDCYCISDEVYEHIIYQGKHHSLQALCPDYSKIISLFSFSKSFAMTGWRVGYMVAKSEVILNVNKLSQYMITSLSPFIQAGAYTALTDPNVRQEQMRMLTSYQERRTLIIDTIKGTWLEHKTFIPQGAFYIFINIEEFKKPSKSFVAEIIEQYGVSFTPGIAFGQESDHAIRMTFASDLPSINKALSTLIQMR